MLSASNKFFSQFQLYLSKRKEIKTEQVSRETPWETLSKFDRSGADPSYVLLAECEVGGAAGEKACGGGWFGIRFC